MTDNAAVVIVLVAGIVLVPLGAWALRIAAMRTPLSRWVWLISALILIVLIGSAIVWTFVADTPPHADMPQPGTQAKEGTGGAAGG